MLLVAAGQFPQSCLVSALCLNKNGSEKTGGIKGRRKEGEKERKEELQEWFDVIIYMFTSH